MKTVLKYLIILIAYPIFWVGRILYVLAKIIEVISHLLMFNKNTAIGEAKDILRVSLNLDDVF